MSRNGSEAVSPVVGVMLMLVITIIIAAVVSAFAGGLGGGQQKTPQVTLAAQPIVQGIEGTLSSHATGWTAANGIEFENTGGDTFSLSDIDIQIEGGGTKYTITPSDAINWSNTVLPSGITAGGYFQKIGNSTSEDNTISPGDKFMFYADNCYISSYDNQKYLVWHPTGATAGIGIPLGKKTEYIVIDRDTSKAMSSGYVVFR